MPAAPPPTAPDLPGASAAKRQQILEGAGRIFAAHGYEGASMSQIARGAGVSKGTLYNYFDSKATLFAAFIQQCACEKLPRLFETIGEERTPEDTLVGIATAMIHLTTSPLSLMLNRIIVSEAATFPHLAETFWQVGPQKAIGILADWLTARTREGTLTVPDPVLAAELFYTLCQTRITGRKRMQLPVDSDPDHIALIARAVTRMFLNTFQTGKGPPVPEPHPHVTA
ncbi:transcriptional regulator, TetR family [Gluconacetobacter diazotrophicus PA1 5]|uniref:Putative transcriptional regulator, TetR family n=1 Tax=Gluconacetobacter diazotrophicus (strain ATCC 49037 / DSM 5601 / CCUG 37298 / CIP 103539 / LMG 7603 / PAl5) TaxID=272568 RepID=A9H9Q2_GLUDA|nr:TetR/AcrR family transcriptional regulator [Gluconacetobacter diazotrophicus]ACI52408.1 transcriptional regulator, TetR family [Gluconacetobacter diazotrophicus PA1 5]TWA98200.1 TetR family transcriptional regulator [Gluconacetobacter diazotrophicus]CAP57738.1 putative transcriptional regulator, TetR family [Gluconacetobacter diazotrophicus PA1 5]